MTKTSTPEQRALGQRIKQAISNSQYNQAQLARQMELHPSNINRWIRGDGSPSIENIVKIGRLTGVSLDWLIGGKGTIDSSTPTVDFDTDPDYKVIPVIQNGVTPFGETTIDSTEKIGIAFTKEWLTSIGNPDNMVLLPVSGEQMAPTLKTGDIVLINRSITRVSPLGGIYALERKRVVVINRLQFAPNGEQVSILSDNKLFKSYESPIDKIEVFGKVVWYGRLLKE